MKQSIIRRLALVLALVVLLSTLGLAEELSLNALELPEIDMDGLSLEDVLIVEGDGLELPDLGDEVEDWEDEDPYADAEPYEPYEPYAPPYRMPPP